MSDEEPRPENPTLPTDPGAGQTEEYPTMSEPPIPPLAYGEEADEDDEWLSTGSARGIRLSVPVALLVAVLLVGGGVWGGATLEKNHGGSSGVAASLASRFRGLRSGATGATGALGGSGFSFAGGGAAAGTTGTISVVAGNTLYVISSTGSLVKVTLTGSTTITRDAGATALDLRPGDVVTIQGATSANGNVTASSITATAPGVSAGGSGFGGAAAAGSAALGGTTTTSGG